MNCRIVADYNFFHTVYMEKPSGFIYYSGIIADYDAIKGISANNINMLQSETEKITESTSVFIKIKQILIRCLPVKLQDMLYCVYLFAHYRYKKVAKSKKR